MLTDRAPSSFWVLTNLTHTHTGNSWEDLKVQQSRVKWTEPGLPWQPVGQCSWSPQTGRCPSCCAHHKGRWNGRREALACLLGCQLLHWFNSQPVALPSPGKEVTCFFQIGGGGVGAGEQVERILKLPGSVHPGDGGHISGEGGGSLFYTWKWVQGRKVPSKYCIIKARRQP